MADILNTFVTSNHKDFTWPYPEPLMLKPAQPPMTTGKRLYLPRPDEDDCKCEEHGFQSDTRRYMQLAEKERLVQSKLLALKRQRTNLASVLLDSNSQSDNETMKSIYEIDYSIKGFPIGRYKPLMAAVDSPIGAPIVPAVTDLRDGYRDPTMFRYSAIERPTIQPPKPMDPTTVPEIFISWNEPFTGRSEYMDTVSKMGLSTMKNRQQYREPIPSSRRRFGDCNL